MKTLNEYINEKLVRTSIKHAEFDSERKSINDRIENSLPYTRNVQFELYDLTESWKRDDGYYIGGDVMFSARDYKRTFDISRFKTCWNDIFKNQGFGDDLNYPVQNNVDKTSEEYKFIKELRDLLEKTFSTNNFTNVRGWEESDKRELSFKTVYNKMPKFESNGLINSLFEIDAFLAGTVNPDPWIEVNIVLYQYKQKDS